MSEDDSPLLEQRGNLIEDIKSLTLSVEIYGLSADKIKLNCLKSKYERLYGHGEISANKEYKISDCDVHRLKNEFYSFEKYKESAEYLKYREGAENLRMIGIWNEPCPDSKLTFVKAHYRRARSNNRDS